MELRLPLCLSHLTSHKALYWLLSSSPCTSITYPAISYISNSTSVGMFADDTKLYCCIKEPCDALALQEDIQSLHSRSDENHLRFNQSKCKVLSITRKSSPLVNTYCLGDEQLLFSDSEVDLGILLSPNLTWSNQVNKVRSKANRMLGLIRRSTLEMTDTKARKLLYLQLVRSNLAYASQVWCLQSVKLIENIEKVQRRATKFIVNLGFMTKIRRQIDFSTWICSL